DDGEQCRRPQHRGSRAARQQEVVDEAAEEGLLGHGGQAHEGDHAQGEGTGSVAPADEAPQGEGGDTGGQGGRSRRPAGRSRRARGSRPSLTDGEQQQEQGDKYNGRMGPVAEEQGPEDEHAAPGGDDDGRCAGPGDGQGVHWVVNCTKARGRFLKGWWSMATNSAWIVWVPGLRPWRSWVVV